MAAQELQQIIYLFLQFVSAFQLYLLLSASLR